MSKIFLIIDRKQEGPFSEGEVHGKLSAGQIDGETFARLDEGSEWFPLSKFLDVPASSRVKKTAGLPSRPVLVWIIAILYLVYYPVVVGRVAWFLIRFPYVAHVSLLMEVGSILLDAIMRITAAILLLMLRKTAVILMVIAFLMDVVQLSLMLLGYLLISQAVHPKAPLHSPRLIAIWMVQITVLIYTGSLVKNRTLR